MNVKQAIEALGKCNPEQTLVGRYVLPDGSVVYAEITILCRDSDGEKGRVLLTAHRVDGWDQLRNDRWYPR